METFKEYLLSEGGMGGKGDYEIYHDSLTSAVQEVEDNIRRQGYEFDPEDIAQKVGFGPSKPTNGDTNKYHVKMVNHRSRWFIFKYMTVVQNGTHTNLTCTYHREYYE